MMRRSGPILSEAGVDFAVVSRHAREVRVCLFDEAGREVERVPLARRDGDMHAGFVAGIGAGQLYGLRVDGVWMPQDGHLFDPTKLLLDPYATRIDRAFRHDPRLGIRGEETAALVPKGIIEAVPARQARPATSCAADLIYEVNVRSFTMRHPDVPAEKRGTVAALAEPAVIDHLVRLGVDAVELMPLTAFIDERHLGVLGLSNAWGYNPVGYFAPDPRLAPGGMAEIAAATAALHEAGIAVILDVVFNHTGESDLQGTTLSLRGLDNALYFRLGADGVPVNDTGCGNTLALDRPVTVALVMDSLRHWVAFGGIDGFRFDLGTVLGRRADGFDPAAPLLQAMAQDPVLRDCIMIAEPWDVGPGGYRLGGFPPGFREWNDRYRDDIRRFWRGDAGMVGALATRLAGSSDLFGGLRRPSASVNFVAAHDGMTLADTVAYAGKHNAANGEDNRDGTSENHSWNHGTEGPSDDPAVRTARTADIRALLALLFVSRGTLMLTAGDEFGRSQSGNNNAYAQDNEFTWLDWAGRDHDLERYAGKLSALRKAHPVLHADRWLTGAGSPPDVDWRGEAGPMQDGDWTAPGRRLLIAVLADPGSQSRVPRRVAIVINAGDAVDVRLPWPERGLAWRLELCSAPGAEPEPVDDVAHLPARCVTILSEAEIAGAGRASPGVSDAETARLAEAHGLATSWWDISGGHHAVPVESLRAILKSLRRPVTTRNEADAAWHLVETARRRVLPPTIVGGARDTSVRLRLPVERAPAQIPLELELEGGERRSLSVDPRDLSVASRDGSYVELLLPLGDVPAGYHRLVMTDGTASHLIVSPAQGHQPARLAGSRKAFGLTTHLYGLRREQDTGIGDFATLARFGATTARLGGEVAGINPLHHLFLQDRTRVSPYQPSDRRFIDPIYLDVAALTAAFGDDATRTLAAEIMPRLALLGQGARIDYVEAWQARERLLRDIFRAFDIGTAPRDAFDRFRAAGGAALEGHTLFQALAARHGGVDRARWPATERQRDPSALAMATREAGEIAFHAFLQWQAEVQFADAGNQSRRAGLDIGILRDLAVGTAFDGGETWSNPERFAAGVSVGAPPDPFSADGQVWNLPPFDPLHLAETGLAAWREVLAANMRHAGALRIDHILGFARLFFVPDGARGSEGAYLRFPRDALIAVTAIESQRAQCLVLGEDLGTAEPGLTPALQEAGVYSTRVLWFEREGRGFADPRRHPAAAVACLSTHDLPTFSGWRIGRDIEIDRQIGRLTDAEAGERQAERIEERNLLANAAGGDDAVAAHRFLGLSGARLVLAQVEDLVGETEPLNVPGTDREWPNWRRRLGLPVEDVAGTAEALAIAAALAQGGRAG